MELTRRDALAALAAVGAGSAAGCSGVDAPAATAGLGDDAIATLTAVAEVVYPSEATGVPGFVENYVLGRVGDDEAHRRGVAAAAADLDAVARDWEGEAYADLPAEARDGLLRELGVDGVTADPDGVLPERVRFFLVDDLLYAFYASPTGGRLVGIENPVGYPGGTASYQTPPPEDVYDE